MTPQNLNPKWPELARQAQEKPSQNPRKADEARYGLSARGGCIQEQVSIPGLQAAGALSRDLGFRCLGV